MRRVRTARVCHVITLLELGGAQQNTLYTLAHLDRERFEPMLVSGKGGLLDPEAERIPSLHRVFLPQLVRPADPAQDAQALFALFRVFREWRPDIVHTHSSKAGILGRWAAHLAGVPVIVHTVHGFGFHSGQPARERRLFRWLEAATSRITTRVLAVSRTNLEEGVAQGVLPRGRVSLVRSGISLSDFRNGSAPDGVRERLGIPRGAPVAGMIGCLKPQKAPLDWVRACARIAAEIPAAHFLLVGDGELREAVETEVARLGLEARFHLLGWRRDIPGILRSTQVIALPSLWEGLPRVIPEAMASGLPVVATRVDGTPEAVEDGVTGFLVDPHDVEGLARRVARLLADPDEARRMGERARTRVGEFDIDEMVRRQEAIYEDLLQGLH